MVEITLAFAVEGACVEEGAALLDGDGLASPILTGETLFFSVRRACVTSRADSCCPIPDAPSNPPTYHLLPQALASPEQDLAAATADVRSQVETLSLVNGARTAVFARNRAR